MTVGHRRQPQLRVGHETQGAPTPDVERVGGGDPVADLGRVRRGAHRAQIKRGELGIALAREDQRQRDGAVEEVSPAGLAGAFRRSRDVEDVVEDLEGQPDRLAERP